MSPKRKDTLEDTGCCDALRDAWLMGYRDVEDAEADNWGLPAQFKCHHDISKEEQKKENVDKV